jgi:hypothetical protein
VYTKLNTRKNALLVKIVCGNFRELATFARRFLFLHKIFSRQYYRAFPPGQMHKKNADRIDQRSRRRQCDNFSWARREIQSTRVRADLTFSKASPAPPEGINQAESL